MLTMTYKKQNPLEADFAADLNTLIIYRGIC